MVLKLYKNHSRFNKINKTLTDELVINGYLREDMSDDGPVLTIERPSGTDINAYSYAYIDIYDAYYFINSKITQEGDLVRLFMSKDPLMTNKDAIMALSGIVSRASNKWNLYLQDSSRQTQQNQNTYVLEFPNSLDAMSYILITSGSYQNLTNKNEGGEG